MMRKHVVALCILALCLATVSCKKLGTGPLKYETAKFTDAVPQDYGPLIGVIQTQAPDVVALWFQRSDGTIVAVFVNVYQARISDKVLTLPRR